MKSKMFLQPLSQRAHKIAPDFLLARTVVGATLDPLQSALAAAEKGRYAAHEHVDLERRVARGDRSQDKG